MDPEATISPDVFHRLELKLPALDRGQQPQSTVARREGTQVPLQQTRLQVLPHAEQFGRPAQLVWHEACAPARGAVIDSITGKRREMPATRHSFRNISRREY